MKHLFEPYLKSASNVVILDGALASELEKRGADIKHRLWSAKLLYENPQLIKDVHKDYLAAGANVITTSSYQATFQGFHKEGFNKDQAKQLLQLSTSLAIEARDEFLRENKVNLSPLIAASIGPYGAYLADGSEYRGHYGLDVDKLISFHRERFEFLLGTGVDLLACETIPCPEEAIALTKLLAEYPDAKAWITFTCKDDIHVSNGEKFEKCVSLVNGSQQVIAVGVNCSNPIYIESLVRIAHSSTNKLIVVYPNKGEQWDDVNKQWLPSTGEVEFAAKAKLWHEAGARLIGGCCRTSPDEIKALRSIFGQAL